MNLPWWLDLLILGPLCFGVFYLASWEIEREIAKGRLAETETATAPVNAETPT